MTLDDLELILRRERLDDTVVPYRHSAEAVMSALNDAQRQAAIRKRLVLDRTTEDVCTYAVAVDGDTVTLHPRVLAVRSARWSETSPAAPLTLTTLKVMDKDCPAWTEADSATPTAVIVDAETGKLVLYPPTDTAGTLTLSVWRSPLESEEMEDGEDEPIIDETFHRDLIDWAEHLLFLGKDGEEGDTQRSNAAEQRFTAKFGRMPSAHEIKCWAISPSRGQRAEFL